MRNIKFSKKCNTADLHKELVAAGFAIHGVSSGDDTIVHLEDTETKDPFPIVDDHVYITPLSTEEIMANDKNIFAAATQSDKIKLIARKVGLE